MKKVFKEIGLLLYQIFAWLAFGNIAIYIATRVINFLNDPYMEDYSVTGYYRDEFGIMFLQTVAFMIIFGLGYSAYKIIIKKKVSNWKYWFIFITTLAITFIGIF